MLIAFEIRDELISMQGALCLAQTPPFWNMCQFYRVYANGSIEDLDRQLIPYMGPNVPEPSRAPKKSVSKRTTAKKTANGTVRKG